MKKLLMLAILLVATASIANAQHDSVTFRTVGSHMLHLQWMVGTWEGHYGDDIVRLHADLTPNGQAIVYDVEIGTSPLMMMPTYHGMYYWDPSKQSYALTQVDIHSSVSEGTFRYTDTSKAEQTLTVHTENGEQQLHSEYTIARDQFEVKSSVRNSEKDPWLPALDVVYRRSTSLARK